jgi:hypothetical protein
LILTLAIAGLVVFVTVAGAATSWSRRGGDDQNTGNAGSDPAFELANMANLKYLFTIPTQGIVNATPIITDDRLLITGDWKGHVYVIDLDTTKRIVDMDTGSGGDATIGNDALSNLGNEFGDYVGMQATPLLATVSTSAGEQHRAYVGVNSAAKTLYCFNLDAIAAVRATVEGDNGTQFFCEGPGGSHPWPRSLAADGPENGNKTLNGSALFAKDHPITLNNVTTEHDVIYTPSTGLDCANGQFWAIDAYTAELLWSFDPVVNGDSTGGTIWTTPAISRDGKWIYITTGDCVGQPQVGEKAESLIALNAATGKIEDGGWFHQRRLVDTADLDVGNGPLVADVDDPNVGCHVVVSFDKDGCVYGFPQERDIPQVGDVGDLANGTTQTQQHGFGYDPLRDGQQRLLYRKCLVSGSLNGGFNASNPAFTIVGAVRGAQGLAVQQASGYPTGHIGADDANAFAIDVCTGRVVWASSDVKNGRTDAAISNGYLFQIAGTVKPAAGDYPYTFVREIQVVDMDAHNYANPRDSDIVGGGIKATVQLPDQPSLGGGGVAIVNGRIYVPTTKGIAVVGLVPGSDASPPQVNGNNIFAGPYPEPIAPGAAGGGLNAVDLYDPYPLLLDSEIRRLGAYNN